MKTTIAFLVFINFFLFTSSPLSAQKPTKGCMEVTAFEVGLDAPVEGFGFVLGAVELSYSVSGDAQKSFELVINGHQGLFRAAGNPTLVLDLMLAKGESHTVTLNTFSSSTPGKGKLGVSPNRGLLKARETACGALNCRLFLVKRAHNLFTVQGS